VTVYTQSLVLIFCFHAMQFLEFGRLRYNGQST